MSQLEHDATAIAERAARYRDQVPECADWARGYGVIRHTDLTQVRVHDLAAGLLERGAVRERGEVYRRLAAADRIANAAMWLVVHMTYARNVSLAGCDLGRDDFKQHPEGHTGGSLNMVPAYVGYLAINAVTSFTRSWLMGQGHCVAAIDATNLIVGNMLPEHAERYSLSDHGLTRFVRDFYLCAVGPDGRPVSPLGSHVNAYTAGGTAEGGYLGFAELQYVHAPLPGERLVTFLSDGAFEEQRGSDWVPRWWRGEDSGLVTPIMIANGRRIDQRTTMAQEGGVAWFREHLRLNGFDPIDVDGRDPAAIAWAIFEMEERLAARAQEISSGARGYPVELPYGIAEAPKGYGFPGAGTNLAHNLPLGANPAADAEARKRFNDGARALWVPFLELVRAVGILNQGRGVVRVAERDHPLANRRPKAPNLPEPPWREQGNGDGESPMASIDEYFCAVIGANPDLRPRVGNPDEMKSNQMTATLDLLKHRVTAPERGMPESVDGGVITALNEEAVVSAALANRGGLNLVVTYEAFAVKMLGAIRQELTFARHQAEAGREPGWLGIPVLLTSHTWENAKNEMSHQDPTLVEALMGEMSDTSRVLFPPDCNSAMAALREAFHSRGKIWSLLVPKQPLPCRLSAGGARQAVEDGAIVVRDDEHPSTLLIAVGAYQLTEALRASDRLAEREIPHRVVSLLEPGRFRVPRDAREGRSMAPAELRERLFPESASRVFLSHTRPEALLGIVRALDTGPERTRALGYINHGGTLDIPGMLFANRCTWAHALLAVAETLGRPA
ncbi:MAG: xylulose 5-phosphate 3-epimerase, partial [Candidatus Binatia bacterium]